MEKITLTINQFLEKLRAGEKNFSGITLQNADFTGMNLSKINLSGSDLSNSNFSGANLSEANFSGANAARCQFKGAILRETTFEKANLEWAVFTSAIFENTNLHAANLMWAHLCKSDLMRADISEAVINWSCLADSKLTVEQMASIPSGAAATITFTYDVSQAGGKIIYGPGGKPSLAAYGSGRISGSYIGQPEEKGEDAEAEHGKSVAYGASSEQAMGYGIIRRQEVAAIDIKRLRPLR